MLPENPIKPRNVLLDENEGSWFLSIFPPSRTGNPAVK